MANLAIKGHATRGKEVIEILEMLGGKNPTKLKGNTINHVYIINSSYYGEIDCLGGVTDAYNVFTLEQFLEKFPYKVGDKVYHIIHNKEQIITNMVWGKQENEVIYQTDNDEYSFVNYLQPYKEETMEESMKMNIVNNDCNNFKINTTTELCENKVITFAKCTLDEVELDLADKFEIVLKEGKYFAVKKRPKYPKTYEECCKLLCSNPIVGFAELDDNEENLYGKFIALKRCRDAYWKIVDWKPEFRFGKKKYCIMTKDNKVITATVEETNRILTFPTEEMRDAFYENFKELIEEVKELL